MCFVSIRVIRFILFKRIPCDMKANTAVILSYCCLLYWAHASLKFKDIFSFKFHRACLKKSGTKTPRVELEEIGPSIDFVLRRTHLAADSLYKEALRQPKAQKVRIYAIMIGII